MKIAACYIMKDEEKNIGISLASIKSVVDGIYIADTGSVDSSKDIAASYGAFLYDFTWCNDFAAAKNYVLSTVPPEYDWILFLDADEYIAKPENFRNALMKLEQENPYVDAIMVPMINVDTTRNNQEKHRFMNIRLFRQKDFLFYEGSIHETLVHKAGKVSYVNADMDLSIIHTGYSEDRIIKKLQRNLAYLQQYEQQHGITEAYARYYADCYFGLKDYKQALKYALQAINGKVSSIGSDSDMYATVLESMRQLAYSDGEMLNVAERAIKEYPALPDFYAERGMIHCGLQDLKSAKEDFLYALKLYDMPQCSDMSASYFANSLFVVYRRLGEIADYEGNIEEARKWFIKSLKNNSYALVTLEAFLATFKENTQDLYQELLAIYENDITYLVKACLQLGYYETYMELKNNYTIIDEITKLQEEKVAEYLTGQAFDESLCVKEIAETVNDLYMTLLQMPLDEFLQDDIQASVRQLPVGLQCCIKSYFERNILGKDTEELYLSQLRKVIQLGKEDVLKKYLMPLKDLTDAARYKAATVLIEEEVWQRGWDMLQTVSADSDQVNGEFWFMSGRCAFALGADDVAQACLAKAIEFDFNREAIDSFLYWIEERSNG